MTRTFVMGDPQAPFAKVMAMLARHGALDGDRLADDVVLVSIGDHFDYDHKDPTAGAEGVRLLRWLASHDPAQVRLLLGNHDAARVMELATISDEEFAAARACPAEEYAARYPELPPQGVLARDYASFSSEQRALVVELLLAGRFQLAHVGELDGREVLITHAGVTRDDLLHLARANPAHEVALVKYAMELGSLSPFEIATALNRHLAAALDEARPPWQRGEITPLSLGPLHRMGSDGEEGDGLLYHRPCANEPDWRPCPPRRFHPSTLLRGGLVQIAGHTGHAKCVEELGDWCTEAARARRHGGIRTLNVLGGNLGGTYDLGVSLQRMSRHEAALILIDGELRRLPPEEVDLLEISRVY